MKSLLIALIIAAVSVASHAQVSGPFYGPVVGGPLNTAVASYVSSCSNSASSGATLGCTFSPSANDLLVGCTSFTLIGGGNVTVTDGTSSFSILSSYTDTVTDYGQCFYLLAANGGSHTYTVTYPNPTNYPWMWVADFHTTSGTWHYDTSAGQGFHSSTNASSGAITTHQAGGEVIVDANTLANVGATVSNPLIGSTTPVEFSFSPLFGQDHIYYLLNTHITSGSATLTYSTATDWIAIAAAFAAY